MSGTDLEIVFILKQQHNWDQMGHYPELYSIINIENKCRRFDQTLILTHRLL